MKRPWPRFQPRRNIDNQAMSWAEAIILLPIVTAVAFVVTLTRVRRRLRTLESAFAGTRLDVSTREEARRAADRSRRQLLADVSHELRAPLTAMRGYLETLHMRDLDLDDVTRARYSQTIEREIVRLDRMVEDLLDLARLEIGVGALDVRMFDIERVFQHVMLRHQPETRMRAIEVDVSVEDAADQLVADPDRIEQAIENLFANALRSTPIGGRIELRAAGDGDAIVLTVVDSGPGIAGDGLRSVFDRFDRFDSADRPRLRRASGSGLGLSIAKAIVERHHGTIGAASEPGRTVFTIVLPHQSAEPRHHATSTNL